ncbi:putative CoA-binding protein [Herbaspirillum rubrisubalbicans]|uniref:CoA-binding protein n=1 Tax=Herbaspirillum rubrisubalbicans TaxID=80842 RepID=UPI0020A140B8|nr:CoA-binding protein [Herbaspirillum rubrisubalbicans]MCP1574879.1 putative CoA-binding protein [Herbaspirillum rubrisubalbicans]
MSSVASSTGQAPLASQANGKPIIAVVGLSNRPERASFDVAAYMQSAGYRIVAVNPMYAGQTILGEHCHASLQEASAALAKEGLRISIVDCFRKSADIPPVVEEAIAIGAHCVWMQLAIVHEEAAERARAAGLQVIMDKCIKIEHAMGQFHGVL